MRDVPLILFGIGGVGRALVEQILRHRRLHAEWYDLTINVLVVCDRTSAAIELGHGINDANLEDLIDLKAAGNSLAEHALGRADHGDVNDVLTVVDRPGAIVVDLTAAETTIPALLHAAQQGYRIVLANKKPLAAQQEVYDRLTRAGVTGGAGSRQGAPLPTRWEATVGAGLPIIATQQRLVAAGDVITRIDGAFSGTLGYLMTGLQAGKSLSDVVREAHRLGFTEPDPRDDLGGMDVARKALILARGLGWTLEIDEVSVTSLYPDTLDGLSVAEFLDALSDLDDEFQAWVADATASNGVLRYTATLEDGKCVVGPSIVELDSPLGRLTGTDNLIEFHSRWYSPTPLVIQGRGAGVEATAAGVLSDIIELARQ